MSSPRTMQPLNVPQNPDSAEERTQRETADAQSVTVEFQSRSLILSHGLWSVFGKLVSILAVFLNTVLIARLVSTDLFVDVNSVRTLMYLLAIAPGCGIAQIALRRLGSLDPLERHGPLPRQIIERILRLFALVAGPIALLTASLLWWSGSWLVKGPLGPLQIFLITTGTISIGVLEVMSEMHRGLGQPAAANLLGGSKGAPLATLLFVVLMALVATSREISFEITNSLFFVAVVFSVAYGWRSLSRCVRRAVAAGSATLLHKSDTDQKGSVSHDSTSSDNRRGSRYADSAVKDFDRPVRPAVFVSLATMMSFATLHGDQLFVNAFLSPEDAAGYVGARRCIQLIAIPLVMVNTVSAGIIMPLLSAGKNRLLEGTLRKFCSLAAIPAIVSALVFAFFPRQSLTLILGAGYENGSTALQILTVGQVVFVMSGSCGMLLSLCGHQTITLTINAVSLAALCAIGLPASHLFGATGLAIVLSSVVAINNLIMWWYARKLTHINTWCSFSWLWTLWRGVTIKTRSHKGTRH